jgi:hypothetical protein
MSCCRLAVAASLLSVWTAGCSPDEPAVEYDEAQVSHIGWHLHETIESLVIVSWHQDVAATAHVEYSIDEGEWLVSPQEAAVDETEVLLLGVPYGHDVTFHVVNDFGSGPLTAPDQVATAGALPAGLPQPSLLRSNVDLWEPSGRWLIGSINEDEGDWDPGTYWRFILDRQGRYVWAQPTPDNHWTIFAQVSHDGRDILWDEITFWSDLVLGPDGQVHRTKIDGSVVRSYPTPHLQHAFVELPDGSIAWGASMGIDDQLRRVTADGTEETLWSCAEYLVSIGEEVDCMHNGLYFDEPRGTFLFSFYSLDSVLEIDRISGEVVHAWGHVDGAWAFDPPDSAFWTQHGPSYTDAGTFLVSTHLSDDVEDGVVREYELDEDLGVLRQIWSFGEDEGIRMESAGEAHRLANGNTLHNMGSGARIREITPENEVVWDVAWASPRLLGRTVLVDDLYPFAP